MITNDIKQKLGEVTEKLEQYLDPWQRGALILALATLLLITAYYLTKSEPKLNSKKEREVEERLMRQMAFFKRLKE